jgi:hypothetical protein
MQRRNWLIVVLSIALVIAVAVILAQGNKGSAQGTPSTAERFQIISAPHTYTDSTGKFIADQKGVFMLDTETGDVWTFRQTDVATNGFWVKTDDAPNRKP